MGRRGWAGQIPAHLHHQPALPRTLLDPTILCASKNTLNLLLMAEAVNPWLTFILLLAICMHTDAFHLPYLPNLLRQFNFVLGVRPALQLYPSRK